MNSLKRVSCNKRHKFSAACSLSKTILSPHILLQNWPDGPKVSTLLRMKVSVIDTQHWPAGNSFKKCKTGCFNHEKHRTC